MTAACIDIPAETPAPRFDILRGVGLAVSVGIILVAPAALALLAFLAG